MSHQVGSVRRAGVFCYVCCWFGSGVCLASVVLAFVSLFCGIVTYRIELDSGDLAVALEGGTLSFWRQFPDSEPPNSLAFEVGFNTYSNRGVINSLKDWSESPWIPTSESMIGWKSIRVPLWNLLALAAITTFVAWRSKRGRSHVGFCSCGYDLTGNVSGRCPECGVFLNPRHHASKKAAPPHA